MAAAAEPLRMSTDAMSSGLISDARFALTVLPWPPVVEDVELSIGTPSTTNSGWLVPDSEDPPRILMSADAPGSPDCVRTSTPGAWAASPGTSFRGLAAGLMAEL